MADLGEQFRSLDRLDPPDLWPEAERRSPGSRPRPRRRHPFVAAVLAFTVAAAGIGFAFWAFRGRSWTSEASRDWHERRPLLHGSLSRGRPLGHAVRCNAVRDLAESGNPRPFASGLSESEFDL
jgi:hypothetical protein